MKKLLFAILAAISMSVFGADITGAGATFPYPIYSKWAQAYKDKTGIGLNYQSIGSGGGIRQIKNKTVTFGATDAPLSAAELQASGLIQFPTVFGGVVPVINIDGIEPGQLKLTGKVLADIFEGKITRWRDARITSLNPTLPIPNRAITVVHRSDGSGTTSIFSEYLSAVSPSWEQNVGAGKALRWLTGVGGKGNEGVASFVRTIYGSIGYVEYAYALQNKLTHARLQNAAGNFVEPTSETFAAAAVGWKAVNGSYKQPIDQKGEQAWPITGATFILIYREPDDLAKVTEALKFFSWAYIHGAKMAEELHYVPMPANIIDDVRKVWAHNGLW